MKKKLALGALLITMVSGMAVQSAHAAWPYNNNQRWAPRPVVQQRWLTQDRQRSFFQNRFRQCRNQVRFAPHSWYNSHNPPNSRYRW